MSRPVVVVSRRWPEEVERKMAAAFDVRLNENDAPMSAAQMRAALQEADAFCPTVSDDVGAQVLSVDNLRAKIIGSYGVGFNHIDLDAAKERGLVVTNTPEVLTDCTADTAMTLLLMAARRAGEGERCVRNREWSGWRPTHMMGTKVTGKTLGMVGMGRIARAVAARAYHGFGMKIIFTDPHPPPEGLTREFRAEPRVSLEHVLRDADFVSLHCPGGKATYHLIGREQLAMMRPGAFLINTARGDVVDQDALVQALDDGVIAGAGLDVYEGEPNVPDALLSRDDVVLFPHLGSATRETRTDMGMRVLENLEAFFNGRAPRDRVV